MKKNFIRNLIYIFLFSILTVLQYNLMFKSRDEIKFQAENNGVSNEPTSSIETNEKNLNKMTFKPLSIEDIKHLENIK